MSHLAQKELLAEAAILARLRHPNIVLFYGMAVEFIDGDSEAIDKYYFVTELCQSSLNKSTLGISRVEDARELAQMLVQIAAGSQGNKQFYIIL